MKNILLTTIMLLTTATVGAQQKAVYLDETKPIEERVEDALARMTLDEKIAVIHAQSKFSSPGVKRLGLPDFWTDDGPHGVRPDVLWDQWEQAGQTNDSCVAFPALTCLAATWNPQMARLYGVSLGEEARYRGKDMILGPGVNINRTPLNGRNFEYMGEDPYLVSRMVVPYIQGLQSTGVAACVKHYALNNDEENRFHVNIVVSDRALHEIYLPAFKAAVQEGGVWGLMGSYNRYKRQHCCHNAILLNKILKGDWKYDGVVLSDWGGAHNTDEAITNGLDMEFGSWTDGMTDGMSNAYYLYYLADAYKNQILEGKRTTKELDEKVRRVLRLFFRTTMNRHRAQGFLCSEAHYEAARTIADEGIVLLKNNGILPLKKMENILVVGENAIKMMTVGGGSSSLKVQREVLPLDGITSYLASRTSPLNITYARGYVGDTIQSFNGVTVGRNIAEKRSAEELRAEAVEKACKADVVIVFGGLNKSNYQDCESHDRKSYELPYGQNELVEALAAVNKNVIFVNISGNAVALPWKDKVAAIIQGWYIGSEAGNALADVITGKVNPSGKLPFTWYTRLEDCAAHALNTYPGEWHDGMLEEEYKEGVYVGYRWTDKQKKRPTYAFGYGMSYTTFKISDVKADSKTIADDKPITVTATVTNTGKVAGAETVQLYIHDVKSSIDRPVKELKGFQKVFLEPGESKTVSITVDVNALKFYDESISDWRAEKGDFEALVGNASDNITAKVKFSY